MKYVAGALAFGVLGVMLLLTACGSGNQIRDNASVVQTVEPAPSARAPAEEIPVCPLTDLALVCRVSPVTAGALEAT